MSHVVAECYQQHLYCRNPENEVHKSQQVQTEWEPLIIFRIPLWKLTGIMEKVITAKKKNVKKKKSWMGYIWTVALGRTPRLPGTKTKGAILPKCWLIRVCPTIESCCGVTQYVTDPKRLPFPFIDFPILRPIDSAPSYLIQNNFICLLNFFTLKIHSVIFFTFTEQLTVSTERK